MRLRVVALWLVMLLPAAAGAVQQAFLIQNSGWMEPFYTDPNSQLRPLIMAVIAAVTAPDEQVFVSVFNQRQPGNRSPRVIYRRGAAEPLAAALDAITPAHKSRSGALADTDFQEAVSQTIVEQFEGRPGLIWIFTNNRNSPNNDQETAARNREFYELLHQEPAIARTLVFPLRMPVTGQRYRANGLMVYVLAYGDAAEAHLIALLRSGRPGQVFTGLPARLKPLDRDCVRLFPQAILNQPGTTVALGEDQRTVVLEVAASQRPAVVEVVAGLENQFFPYTITSADLSAGFAVGGSSSPLTIVPARISGLAPGARDEVRVALSIPLAQIPSVWSLAGLRSLGKRFEIQGAVDIRLDHQVLAISEEFRRDLAELFPGDPLSEVFSPPRELLASGVSIPLMIRVTYPVYPLLVIGALLLGVLAAAAVLLRAVSAARSFDVSIDGALQQYRLRLFESRPLYAADGQVVATLRRGLAGAAIRGAVPGHRVDLRT